MHCKIKINDFLKNNILTNLKIHKNQSLGLYFKNTLDSKLNKYNKEVIVLYLKKDFIERKLNLPFQVCDYYFWNEMVVFKVIENNETKLYIYDLKENEIVRKIEIPFLVKEFAISKSKIYFTAEVQNDSLNSNIKCSSKGPFYCEGIGVKGNGITSLFKSDFLVKNIEMITSLDMDVNEVDFDFVNNSIMFSAFKVKKIKPIDSNIYIYDIESEYLKSYDEGSYRISSIKVIDENNFIFMGVDLNEKSRNDNQQVYIINKNNHLIKRLGKYIDRSNENPSVITDCCFPSGKMVKKYNYEFYYKRILEDREMLYKINLEGEITEINTGLKVISCYEVTDNGIFLIGLKDLGLHEIYVYKNNKLKKLSNYSKWLESYKLSYGEKVTYENKGTKLNGYVFKPIGFDKSKNYPGILMIHGGPKMIYSDVFSFDVQLLCSKGYYVFFMNPRGSDGRGDEFANIRGDFSKGPYSDIIGFVDYVLKNNPSLNEKALGVTGGSYGGYMTNYIITKTNRFKAAISERGISNLVTAFTSSDIGYKFIYEYMGNNFNPWENIDIYMENSPINKANEVKTPTLFIHGKNDYRCHYTESLNMYSALNYLNVDSKFCLFEGENHCLVIKGLPNSKRRRFKEHLNWFNKYLKEGRK